MTIERQHFRLDGIYPQRQKEFFMQRVKLPAGIISTDQALKVAQIAERYGIRAGTVRATATRNRAPDFGERRSNLRWERPS